METNLRWRYQMLNAISAIAAIIPTQEIVHIQINNGKETVRNTLLTIVRSCGTFPPIKKNIIIRQQNISVLISIQTSIFSITQYSQSYVKLKSTHQSNALYSTMSNFHFEYHSTQVSHNFHLSLVQFESKQYDLLEN